MANEKMDSVQEVVERLGVVGTVREVWLSANTLLAAVGVCVKRSQISRFTNWVSVDRDALVYASDGRAAAVVGRGFELTDEDKRQFGVLAHAPGVPGVADRVRRGHPSMLVRGFLIPVAVAKDIARAIPKDKKTRSVRKDMALFRVEGDSRVVATVFGKAGARSRVRRWEWRDDEAAFPVSGAQDVMYGQMGKALTPGWRERSFTIGVPYLDALLKTAKGLRSDSVTVTPPEGRADGTMPSALMCHVKSGPGENEFAVVAVMPMRGGGGTEPDPTKVFGDWFPMFLAKMKEGHEKKRTSLGRSLPDPDPVPQNEEGGPDVAEV